jgi:hypothetical protein
MAAVFSSKTSVNFYYDNVAPAFQKIVTLLLIILPCQAGMCYAEMGITISIVLALSDEYV